MIKFPSHLIEDGHERRGLAHREGSVDGEVGRRQEEHAAVVAVVELVVYLPHEEGVRVSVDALHAFLVVDDEVVVHVYRFPHFLNHVGFGVLEGWGLVGTYP